MIASTEQGRATFIFASSVTIFTAGSASKHATATLASPWMEGYIEVRLRRKNSLLGLMCTTGHASYSTDIQQGVEDHRCSLSRLTGALNCLTHTHTTVLPLAQKEQGLAP